MNARTRLTDIFEMTKNIASICPLLANKNIDPLKHVPYNK